MYEARLSTNLCLTLGFLTVCVFLCGCEKTDQVAAYTVPTHESLQTPEYLTELAQRHPTPVPRRMIAVVIPTKPWLWFLKLEGDVDGVAARETEVRSFLKTISLADPERMEWTLPTGWQRLPGNEMRYATLVLSGTPPLEMSVTRLPTQPDLDLTDQILANINRWRGQLSLSAIEAEELNREAEKLPINDTFAYWVNLLGSAIPKQPSMQQMPKPAAKSEQAEPGMPKFDQPAEWQVAPPTMFAKVSLQVIDADQKVMITVTPAKGNPLDNLNRWRGQLKLDPIEANQFASAGRPVEVGKLSGNLYDLTNGERAILGVIVEDRGSLWFVKMDGNQALAERERGRFEAFLKSLVLDE